MLTAITGNMGKELPHSTMRDIVRVIFRRKKLFVLFFLATMIVVFAITFLSPKIYRSEASLLVKLGRESVMIDPTATIGQIANVRQDRTSEINSELQILRSRDLYETVVGRLGVETFQKGYTGSGKIGSSAVQEFLGWMKSMKSELIGRIRSFLNTDAEAETARKQREREKTVDELMQNVAVQAVPESNVITLSYDGESPEMAHKVLQTLICDLS